MNVWKDDEVTRLPPKKMNWRDKTLSEVFTHSWRYITIGLAIFFALIIFAACGAKQAEPFKDAERGTTNNDPADTITFPDGFSNVSTKCDNGNRVYVIFKGDAFYGSVAVVPDDPSCS